MDFITHVPIDLTALKSYHIDFLLNPKNDQLIINLFQPEASNNGITKYLQNSDDIYQEIKNKIVLIQL